MIDVREAIVLAGGFGTRLRSVVSEVPKPLAPVAGRPFLFYILESLQAAGVARVILAIGHRGEMIEQAVDGRFVQLSIEFSREECPLGTGGALWQALSKCQDERVFALNGDTYLALDYAAFAASQPKADILVAVRPVADRSRYGSVKLDGARILGFEEKGAAGPGLVNSGNYLLRSDLRTRLPFNGAFSFEQEILHGHVDGLSIEAFATEADFIDIGTPADFALAQRVLPAWVRRNV